MAARLFSMVFFGVWVGCSSSPQRSEVIPPLIPVELFFKNPELTSWTISPDGKWLAYLKPYKNRLNVHIKSVADLGVPDGAEKRLTEFEDRDVFPTLHWKGNSTLLFLKDVGGDENFHIYALDTNSGKPRDLTPFKQVKAEIYNLFSSMEGDEILIGLNKRNPRFFDGYLLNVKTGALKLVAKNPGSVLEWVADNAGVVRIGLVSDGRKTKLLYRRSAKDLFRIVLESDFKNSITPMAFTLDNKNLLMLSNLDRDKTSVVIFDPEKKREAHELYIDSTHDVSSLMISGFTAKLHAAVIYRAKMELHFFDSDHQNLYQSIQGHLPRSEIMLLSSDAAESQFVVRASSDLSLATHYLYDKAKNKLTKLGDEAPWLAESDMSEMRPIEYQARDGLQISGYLTLPKGRKPKDLPLVVLPHGGPWARDFWGFNRTVQLLANRGYAVLQMNFRGSTSYGKSFWLASFKQWGLAMQNDITDGVRALLDQGIADAKRICIFGTSYGGYATLAGLAFTPDLYACGVDYVGISNLFTLLGSIPSYWEPMREKLYEMIGHPEKDKDLLTATSPVFHASKIKAALLVAQGANDPRVNKSESDQIVAALNKRGVAVQYMVKANEGHGFRNEENRIEFYKATDEFLGRYLN